MHTFSFITVNLSNCLITHTSSFVLSLIGLVTDSTESKIHSARAAGSSSVASISNSLHVLHYYVEPSPYIESFPTDHYFYYDWPILN